MKIGDLINCTRHQEAFGYFTGFLDQIRKGTAK